MKDIWDILDNEDSVSSEPSRSAELEVAKLPPVEELQYLSVRKTKASRGHSGAFKFVGMHHDLRIRATIVCLSNSIRNFCCRFHDQPTSPLPSKRIIVSKDAQRKELLAKLCVYLREVESVGPPKSPSPSRPRRSGGTDGSGRGAPAPAEGGF